KAKLFFNIAHLYVEKNTPRYFVVAAWFYDSCVDLFLRLLLGGVAGDSSFRGTSAEDGFIIVDYLFFLRCCLGKLLITHTPFIEIWGDIYFALAYMSKPLLPQKYIVLQILVYYLALVIFCKTIKILFRLVLYFVFIEVVSVFAGKQEHDGNGMVYCRNGNENDS
ncbi:hypothetical protein ACJX0J_005556, partial [Zea mays]